MQKRKQKKNTGLKIVLIVLIAAIVLLGSYSRLKKAAVKTAAEVVIRNQLADYGITDQQIDSVLDQIEEEDQETVTSIISEHVSGSSVQAVSDYIASGDLKGLAEYAESELSENEKQELIGLAEKYRKKITLP